MLLLQSSLLFALNLAIATVLISGLTLAVSAYFRSMPGRHAALVAGTIICLLAPCVVVIAGILATGRLTTEIHRLHAPIAIDNHGADIAAVMSDRRNVPHSTDYVTVDTESLEQFSVNQSWDTRLPRRSRPLEAKMILEKQMSMAKLGAADSMQLLPASVVKSLTRTGTVSRWQPLRFGVLNQAGLTSRLTLTKSADSR